jgi:hypothetical protein
MTGGAPPPEYPDDPVFPLHIAIQGTYAAYQTTPPEELRSGGRRFKNIIFALVENHKRVKIYIAVGSQSYLNEYPQGVILLCLRGTSPVGRDLPSDILLSSTIYNVHELSLYKEIRYAVDTYFSAYIEREGHHPYVLACGHSLGGALCDQLY